MMSDIIVYDNGEVELNISVENEMIWLTQKQIANLFDKDTRTVNDHIKTIYKDLELDENATIRKFRIVQKEGKREVLNNYHDRFLTLDHNEAYYIGASLKDLGKKVFAFSEIDREMLRLDDE